MHMRRVALTIAACFLSTLVSQAEIYRQTSNQPIPGTTGIVPGQGVDLQGLNLASAILWSKNLTNANLSNADLTKATLWRSNLTGALLNGAIVTRSDLGSTRNLSDTQFYSTANYVLGNLEGIGLSNNDLLGWSFQGKKLMEGNFATSDLTGSTFQSANLTNASFEFSTLVDVNFTNARINGTDFRSTTASGFTEDQLASTASYQNFDLRGIKLWENNLSGWNLARQDLRDATFFNSVLLNTDFTDASISGAQLAGVTSRGYISKQLYQTASYKYGDLRGINLSENDLSGWNFRGKNLEGADFFRANVEGADFTDAVIRNAVIGEGMNQEQFYSTASYQQGDLRGVAFAGSNLTDWDLSHQDLRDAKLTYSVIKNADLAGAKISGADFGYSGLREDQLVSTESYRQKNLRHVGFTGNNLTGWNLSNQDLTNASLVLATLTDTNLANARITGADLGRTTENGLTKEQFYSTANYRQRDLRGVSLRNNDVDNWDFRYQTLTGASFSSSSLKNADFTNAIVLNTSFENTTNSGFTKDQLYSTASYRNRDLRGIRLQANSLRNWDFSEQDLTNADFFLSDITNVNYSDSNLTGALIEPTSGTNLTGANLKNATLRGENVEFALYDENTVYNQWTVFPTDFDPVVAGLHFEESEAGDFGGQNGLDVADVDALIQRIRGVHPSKSYSANEMFDVNGDQQIDDADLNYWVFELKQTVFGDSNLDGMFDSRDLVMAFQGGQYEDNLVGNATWATGDWNGDAEFDTADMIIAFQDGGFESVNAAVRAVPEPASALLMVLASFALMGRGGRRRK